nr:hypothetical protein [uncultured Flavobacterium sp.]
MKAFKLTIILIAIFSFVSFDTVKKVNDDQILWDSSRKLVWEDFKGDVDASMPKIEALTASIIEVSSSYYENEVPKFNVYSYFVKSKSWTKTDSESTLEHEQLHFDITEIYARKIRKSFDSLNKRKCTDIKKYEDIYARYAKLCSNYQNAYDKAVYPSEVEQRNWSRKINAELIRSKKYAYIPAEVSTTP